MTEFDLEIFQVGEYKNISPKKANLEAGTNPIPMNQYIVIEKVFENGLEKTKSFKQQNGEMKESKFYIMKVKYKNEDVGFIINENEHKSFASAGKAGDKIKMTHVRKSWDKKQSDGTTKTQYYTELEFSEL